MKHTPETPLPFKVAQQADGNGPAVLHDARGDNLFPLSTRQAAYIAHAANAYPKLVKALRDARLRYADMRHRLGGEVAPSFERADESHATLLREIGEDA